MKLTIKNILVWCAGLLAVVAFFLMFAPALKNGSTTYEGVKVLFGEKVTALGITIETKGAIGSFIGYLLVLLGGICAVVISFIMKDEKMAKIITLAAAALILVGAILVFCEKAMYYSANNVEVSGTDYTKLAAGPIVAGIMAIISAGALAVSQLVKLDK